MRKITIHDRSEYELLKRKYMRSYFYAKYVLAGSLIQTLLCEQLLLKEKFTNCLPCEDENIKEIIGKIQIRRK